MEIKSMALSTVGDPFKGTGLDEFVAHFGLFPLKPILADLGIASLDKLVHVLSEQTSMKKIEEQTSTTDFESLLHAIRMTDVKNVINEKPIAYGLRSGNKKRSGKRKKQEDDEDEDPEVRDMWKKKVNIRALHNQLKKAASLDLVILLDCTGSMGSYLRDIQSHISTLVSAVGHLHPDTSLRLAFVGYHHVQNNFVDSKQYIQRFTKDVSVFRTVLNTLYASGGGYDALADVAGGLKIVSELDWQATTRIIFHIGDMPCHGSKYHSSLMQDMYPGGDPNGIVVEDTLTALHAAGVEYYFGRLTAYTDDMIQVFNQHFKDLSAPATALTTTSLVHRDADALKTNTEKCDQEELSDVDGEEEVDGCSNDNDGDDEKEEVNDDGDYDEDEDEDSFADDEWNECSDNGNEEEYIKQIDIKDPSLLLSTITGKVTESMTASLTTSFSTHTTLGELLTQFGSLNVKTPKWKQLSYEPGQLHGIPLPESRDEMMLEPFALLEARHAAFEPLFATSTESSGNEKSDRYSQETSLGSLSVSTAGDESGCQVKLGAEPFARGACRNAYRARVTSNPPRSFRGRLRSSSLPAAPRFDLPGIVKLPLQSTRQLEAMSGGHSTALNLQHAYVAARYLAQEFNTRVILAASTREDDSTLTCPTVMFNTVTLLHLPSRVGPQQFATVEHDISIPRPTAELLALQTNTFTGSGQFAKSSPSLNAIATDPTHLTSSHRTKLKFEKFNGNHGLCVPNPSPHGTDHSIVQAFSHWSYEETEQALVVVDCQGVFHPGSEESRGVFLLTDPAIHATNVMKFGGTNLGAEGMKRFFQTHQCNSHCALLELTPRGGV